MTSRHLIIAALLLALTVPAAAIDCALVIGHLDYCEANDPKYLPA